MLTNTDQIKSLNFKTLVFGIFLSLVYDIVWFFVEDVSNDSNDGGVQKSVRNFSLYLSYISFFFRVSYFILITFQIVMGLIFWKDSLDFNRIIKLQQDVVDNKTGYSSGSPDKGGRYTTYKQTADQVVQQIRS